MSKIFQHHYIWYIFSILLFVVALIFAWKGIMSYGLPEPDIGKLCLEKDCIPIPEVVQLEHAQQDLAEIPPAFSAIKIPIFIYHSIRPYIKGESQEQDTYDITPELFEEQMNYLKEEHYNIISLDDVVRAFTEGSSTLPEKPVLITFDDGWRNQYTYGFPILKKYKVKATFYVYTNPIGAKHFLTWDQIKEMKDAGMTIASHTLTHPYLKKISQTQLRYEIFESKKILEEHLGTKVDHFASPFGYSDKNIVDLLREAGYLTGRTTYWGTRQDNPLFLRGILVSDRMSDFIGALHSKK